MINENEIKLRKELFWVYTNILENFGTFNKEEIKKRLDELRYEDISSTKSDSCYNCGHVRFEHEEQDKPTRCMHANGRGCKCKFFWLKNTSSTNCAECEHPHDKNNTDLPCKVCGCGEFKESTENKGESK